MEKINSLELRKRLFGEFMEYLKQAGVDPEMFDRKLWLEKAWDVLHRRYESDDRIIASRFISAMESAQLRELADKKDAEAK